MIETLSRSQAELPRLVEIASRGEDVVITVDGKPRARLTRANDEPSNGAPRKSNKNLERRVQELAEMREKYRTGKPGATVDEILSETRSEHS